MKRERNIDTTTMLNMQMISTLSEIMTWSVGPLWENTSSDASHAPGLVVPLGEWATVEPTIKIGKESWWKWSAGRRPTHLVAKQQHAAEEDQKDADSAAK